MRGDIPAEGRAAGNLVVVRYVGMFTSLSPISACFVFETDAYRAKG